MANTKAWINPTKYSRKKKGRGTITGIKAIIIINNTSPANTFPKSRKEKDSTFANSPTNSNSPTKKNIGPLLKIKNLDQCLKNPNFLIRYH